MEFVKDGITFKLSGDTNKCYAETEYHIFSGHVMNEHNYAVIFKNLYECHDECSLSFVHYDFARTPINNLADVVEHTGKFVAKFITPKLLVGAHLYFYCEPSGFTEKGEQFKNLKQIKSAIDLLRNRVEADKNRIQEDEAIIARLENLYESDKERYGIDC